MKYTEFCDGGYTHIFAEAEYLGAGEVIGDCLVHLLYAAQEDGTPDLRGDQFEWIGVWAEGAPIAAPSTVEELAALHDDTDYEELSPSDHFYFADSDSVRYKDGSLAVRMYSKQEREETAQDYYFAKPWEA